MDAMAEGAKAFVDAAISGPPPEPWGKPDMSMLRLGRRPPPALPLDVFGQPWATWITETAEAAGAPVDYVAMPFLASASALIGHARWAHATGDWREPPHLWVGVVGDSGSSKTPAYATLTRDILPKLEERMKGDFPDRLNDWRAVAEMARAKEDAWKGDVKKALKTNNPPPLPPAESCPPEPQLPRLRMSDVTIEKLASLLATASPKGILVTRDELSGWLAGMNSYNDSGRAFWIEAWNGQLYRVERQKLAEPIVIPRLAVAVTGGTQPEKLAEMFRGPDDGLLARIIWAWPEPLPFRLGHKTPSVTFAIDALDRLRLLELAPAIGNAPPSPVFVPLVQSALPMIEAFGQAMQAKQASAGGLLRSAYGKARGLALRLSLIVEMLQWCGELGMTAPPAIISETSLAAACDLVADYFMPMAERVYGDAAATEVERNATTLAKWIIKARPPEVYVRKLQREVRLPGLTTAEAIHAAARALVEADWLRPPAPSTQQGRAKEAYAINPALWEATP